jgi:hypothetical protein
VTGWQWFGLAVAVGLPLAVLVATLVWPQRIPPGRSVEEIRRRVEDEDNSPPRRR